MTYNVHRDPTQPQILFDWHDPLRELKIAAMECQNRIAWLTQNIRIELRAMTNPQNSAQRRQYARDWILYARRQRRTFTNTQKAIEAKIADARKDANEDPQS